MKLKNIEIIQEKIACGEKVTNMNSTYYDCRNLTTVTIGSGVREIGAGSFITGKSTSKLTKIYCKAKTPPALKGSLNSTLPSTAIIYVPRSSVEEYRIIWSDYADKIVGYDFE